jgi:N-acetylneuraminic acid mutarotase
MRKKFITLLASQASSESVSWYRAGGAPAPVAVYEPLGKRLLATSYQNVFNPGTNDATTSAVPNLTALGWVGYGESYLATGLLAKSGWSAVCRFSDVSGLDATAQYLFGTVRDSGTRAFAIQCNEMGNVTYYNGNYLTISPRLNGGVLAVAGNKAYRNGTAETGNIGAWSGDGITEILLMAVNYVGIPGRLFGAAQAFAFWDVTLTPEQVAAVTTAVNALSVPSQITLLAPMPGAKEEHHLEECGGKLYAVGGGAVSGYTPKKLYEYDPALNTWATKADLPFADAYRESAAFRCVGTKLYFIGGLSETDVKASVYEYDPAGNTWAEKTAMPTPREDFGTAVVGTKIYCFGGITTGQAIIKTLEIYDASNDTWDTTKADMPDYKLFGDFGAACGGKVYAVGASNVFASYPNLIPSTAVYCYDPDTNQWSTKSPIPVSTCYKEVAVVGNNLYVVSGATARTGADAEAYRSWDIYIYNTLTDTWSLSDCPAPYAAAGIASAEYDGSVYVCGGVGGNRNLFRLDL